MKREGERSRKGKTDARAERVKAAAAARGCRLSRSRKYYCDQSVRAEAVQTGDENRFCYLLTVKMAAKRFTLKKAAQKIALGQKLAGKPAGNRVPPECTHCDLQCKRISYALIP